jgi:hypothetical protein
MASFLHQRKSCPAGETANGPTLETIMKSLEMKKLAAIVLASTAAFSGSAKAESVLDTNPAGGFVAAARHDFIVVIPTFLFFGVGPGALTPLVANASIGAITFTVPAANVGDASAVAGTGGDAAASAVNVSLRGNAGPITITETNDSPGGVGLITAAGFLTDGAIPLTQISTSSSNANLNAPALSNAGGGTSTPLVTSRVTNQTAVWTYSYINTVTPAAGTYGGLGRGRVTYTATMP